MRAILTVGISASGKSTWASQQNGFKVLERDSLRRDFLVHKNEYIADSNLWSLWKFTKENEKSISLEYNKWIEYFAQSEKDIICADTNLNSGFRDTLIQKLKDLGYEVEIKYFPIDFMEAVKRDEKRRDTVGRDIIYKQWKQYEEQFSTRKKYVKDPLNMCKAILVDIDGTLAHMKNKRGPFEWDKVNLDELDETVRNFTSLYQMNNSLLSVIILSGRDSVCRELTENWLRDNKVLYTKLFMRKEGDMRKDTIVKEEIFWEHIAPFYDVEFVVDDRVSVCNMWRDIGLFVFQVGDPNCVF